MQEHIDEEGARRSRWRGRVVLAAFVVLVAVAALLFAAYDDAPNTFDLSARIDAVLAKTRSPRVTLTAIPPVLRQAVIATEDERFYRHHGIDTLGVLRAVAYDVTHLSAAQGASTITEQLAKILYLNGNDGNPWRKLVDAATAFRIEQHYSKETILTSYLEIIYFGHGAYGVEEASRTYFGIAPGQLDLARASLLAGLIQAPSAFDPLEHPQGARGRQIGVLRSMVRNGFITEEEGVDVLERPLALRGGSALPARAVVSLAPGSLLSRTAIAVAAALFFAGLIALFFRRVHAGAAWRWAARLCVLAGLVIAARAARGLTHVCLWSGPLPIIV
ncbi:MAG TPA: biosynthetic peptidoglycan transglycosylase [Actinomycetota bacterium]|nr:biosynthetic peptidoglycan transglycosylase [Actinomycetota bacterium]